MNVAAQTPVMNKTSQCQVKLETKSKSMFGGDTKHCPMRVSFRLEAKEIDSPGASATQSGPSTGMFDTASEMTDMDVGMDSEDEDDGSSAGTHPSHALLACPCYPTHLERLFSVASPVSVRHVSMLICGVVV